MGEDVDKVENTLGLYFAFKDLKYDETANLRVKIVDTGKMVFKLILIISWK